MSGSEFHTCVIWPGSMHAHEDILRALQESFQVVGLYRLTWSPLRIVRNLEQFYAVSLAGETDERCREILLGKAAAIEAGPFLFALLEDTNATYELRETTNGATQVHARLFDLKESWRAAGLRIHASNTPAEAARDSLLLLGTPIAEAAVFWKETGRGAPILRMRNVLGVPRWCNLRELFGVLNKSVRYCVLRNFESLPESMPPGAHPDLDLLVEDVATARRVLCGESMYPDDLHRPHVAVKIGAQIVCFDLRSPDDGYLDPVWARAMLERRVFSNGIWVPDPEDYRHCLLYHALIHKLEMAEDYRVIFADLFDGPSPVVDSLQMALHEYMREQDYGYPIPDDGSVRWNVRNLPSADTMPFDSIQELCRRPDGPGGRSIVFRGSVSGEPRILKLLPAERAEVEAQGYQRLAGMGVTPVLFALQSMGSYTAFLFESMDGCTLADVGGRFFMKKSLAEICTMVESLLQILDRLAEAGIRHCDIRPENILVSRDMTCRLIDLEWSGTVAEIADREVPEDLGVHYRPARGVLSDAHSLARVLDEKIGGRSRELDDCISALLQLSRDATIHEDAYREQLAAICDKVATLRESAAAAGVLGGLRDRWHALGYALRKMHVRYPQPRNSAKTNPLSWREWWRWWLIHLRLFLVHHGILSRVSERRH